MPFYCLFIQIFINSIALVTIKMLFGMAIFNTSEQSSAFNHEDGSWASEPKARNPTVRKQFFTTKRGSTKFQTKEVMLLGAACL
jgi:hypothetical protein